ncbi:MAG: hypothetical protein HY814_03125 [Candidatus Riflebacteria bacterium]|nr:hypothetical protein [Candidatus Riflebacteria bacterium]
MGLRLSSIILVVLWILVALPLAGPVSAGPTTEPDAAYTELQKKGFFLDAGGQPLPGGEAVSRYDIADWVARSLEMMSAARQAGPVRLVGSKGKSVESLLLELRAESGSIGGRLDRMIEGQEQLQKDVRDLRARRARRH